MFSVETRYIFQVPHFLVIKIYLRTDKATLHNKGTCCQACLPEFDPQDPHDRRREVSPSGCLWASTHTLWHSQVHMHIETQ